MDEIKYSPRPEDRKYLRLNSQSGSTLLMILAPMTFIFTLAFIALNFVPNYMQEFRVAKISLTLVEDNVINMIENNAAWTNTLADPDNGLACVTDMTIQCNPADGPRPLVLRDAANSVYINSQQGTGFDYSGNPCTAFNPDSANPHCPVSYNLQWEPLCPGAAPCSSPIVKITGTMLHPQRAFRVKIKTSTYDFEYFR